MNRHIVVIVLWCLLSYINLLCISFDPFYKTTLLRKLRQSPGKGNVGWRFGGKPPGYQARKEDARLYEPP